MNPFYSICIPCYKRVELLRNTLKSIYEENSDVSLSDYEVVISDNDPQHEAAAVAEEFSQYANFHYFKTKCEGFMNSYFALSYGQGEFLKLHNSQVKLKPGILKTLIEEVKNNVKEKTLIFYTSGFIGHYSSLYYNDFEDFMHSLSYWSSWSGGMTIWRENFINVKDIKVNSLFPQTSILFTQYNKNKYCINDNVIYDIQRVPQRGDHNKFEAFTIQYPSLIDSIWRKGYISKGCRDHIFKAIYEEFLPSLLFNKYIACIETFPIDGFKNNCMTYFPTKAYYIAWFNVLFVPFRIIKRKIGNIIHHK